MTLFLGSGLRNRLLAFAFTHVDQSYYVRQLADDIGADAGNLSRELKVLEKEGLFTSRAKGREKYFSLNSSYPLFADIRNIVMKTSGIEGRLKLLVGRYNGIELAFIYGSYGSKRETAGSDVDLIIVGRCDRVNFTRGIRAIESRLRREINVTFYEQKEFSQERMKRGGFLDLVLKGKIIILKGELSDR